VRILRGRIPVTFENDNNVIIFPFEKLISYARDNQYIFLAQSIWWISSIIGLQEGLIRQINNQQKQCKVSSEKKREVSATSRDIQEEQCVLWSSNSNREDPEDLNSRRQGQILRECEEILRNSRHLWKIAYLKSTGKNLADRINPF